RPDRRSLGGAGALAAGWVAPVGGQLAVNWGGLHTRTAYDTTHESTAFSTAYFAHNWGLTARQLSSLGLPVVLPLGILGLVILAVRERHLAAILWAWLLPNLVLYTAYYWALENDQIAYLRFFL